MGYVFDISGFKAFILEESGRFRIDGLSIWYNSIPIPVDLFEIFFDSWRDNFKIYLDHLMVALMLEQLLQEHEELELSVQDFPNAEAIKSKRQALFKVLSECKSTRSEFASLAQELAAILSVENYQFDINDLLDAASIEGKKYKRMFLPKEFRKLIKIRIAGSLDSVATSNGDMFGNIIADRLKLYRSGFSDALAGLFNKLLEYKIDKCSGFIAVTGSSILRFGDEGSSNKLIQVIKEKTVDGSLWEPLFDGEIKIRLNPSHPHYEVITKCSNPEAVIKILGVMARLEMNCSNGNELKIIENVRARISRELWMSD